MRIPDTVPHSGLLPAVLVTACLLVPAAPAAVVSEYSKGHGDIGIAYEDGAFEPHWHLHSGAVVDGSALGADEEYEPDALVALVPGPSIARPAGTQWDFLGVAAGEPFWFLPQNEDVNKPYLGIASEELTPADWTSLTLSLAGMSGPAGGHFSLWEIGTFGELTVKFATSDGITGADSFAQIVGSHAHYNWGFTKPGDYELTFRWDGVHSMDGAISAEGTFGFTVVPEPGTYAAVFGALALGGAWLHRRRKMTAA